MPPQKRQKLADIRADSAAGRAETQITKAVRGKEPKGANEREDSRDKNSKSKMTVAKCHDRAVPSPAKIAMLATTRVRLEVDGVMGLSVRGLCDSGSQINLITTECVRRLGLKRYQCHAEIVGIGGDQPVRSYGIIRANLYHHSHAKKVTPIELLIVKKISTWMPSQKIERPFSDEIGNEELADPNFAVPSRIELLLGAGVWGTIIEEGVKRNDDGLTAQKTSLGWAIFGGGQRVGGCLPRALHARPRDSDLNETIRKFWESEELSTDRKRSLDEEWVENNFAATHGRDATGRYVVTIPIDPKAGPLGESRSQAKNRFLSMERRRARDKALDDKVIKFMSEYESDGHMQRAKEPPYPDRHCYIPYHPINKKKFRMVFDASAATTSGRSFNDVQLAGEKLQAELIDLVLKFRTFKFGLTADIVKMFRQVRVNEDQWDYQRIFWRKKPTDVLEEFVLTVVTYGMKSSGYNAVRALLQCALDNEAQFPLAAKIIRENFYMDDLLSGADTTEELIHVKEETTKSLQSGGFELRKWMTNHPGLREELVGDAGEEVKLSEDAETGVLGMVWLPKSDEIRFNLRTRDELHQDIPTKRMVVGEIARLYDPIGQLSPVVIRAKVTIQELWRVGISWDDKLPPEEAVKWYRFHKNLPGLRDLKIPRWIGTTADCSIQLHGFADASKQAYAAAVYIRVTRINGETQCRLITSKTRVAPIITKSIPKLELSAAELLGRLMLKVKHACGFENAISVFHSDSTIVLFWIRKLPCDLKTFVANKVASIQETTAGSQWRHIKGTEKPADLATRGMNSEELINSELWWKGPSWLPKSSNEWPQRMPNDLNPEEWREHEDGVKMFVATGTLWPSQTLCTDTTPGKREPLIFRSSTWASTLRVTAFVQRCVRQMKRHVDRDRNDKIEQISMEERDAALMYWVKATQAVHFRREIKELRSDKAIKTLPSDSVLNPLAPFLDGKGVLRVGGRLNNALIPYDAAYPIILPGKCAVSERLIREAHLKVLHGGTQMILQFLRQRFWIIGVRRIVGTYINKCIQCFRQRQAVSEQLMGDLPACRVIKARPFVTCAVDFAGPITLKRWKGLCRSTEKGYMAVFICPVTRAVHLDVVDDLSTEEFMETFRRFSARRGHCREMWSDNGTNFVGTDNEMQQILESWKGKIPDGILNELGIKWRFITPAAPHQGGLWESTVKAVKHHLKRLAGKHAYTARQLYTILTQIEGCPNSRPISAIRDDAGDLSPLTPGHFIIGEQMVQPLAPDFTGIPENRLKLWAVRQKSFQEFWQRWQDEYLLAIQKRYKWQHIQPNLKVGDLVFIRHENTAPTIWPMGRVEETYPGADGRVRSVLVKTGTSLLKRPIQKLCVLPIEDGKPSEF